jgi:hypothetical protein
MTKKILISTLVTTIVLFLWSGITQMFPWGVPTAQAISTQSSKKTDSFQTPNLIELPANSLTTEQFDAQLVGKISTLTTDKTFSWIISSPISYYNVGNYFMREIFTQLIVALLLSLLLWQIRGFNLITRLQIVGIAAIMGTIATYGQQLNWWGMPSLYAFGAAFNLIAGWLLAGLILSKWIIKQME